MTEYLATDIQIPPGARIEIKNGVLAAKDKDGNVLALTVNWEMIEE